MSAAYQQFLASLDSGLTTDKAVEAAWNAALDAAAGVCREQSASVGRANPGRGKGSVSHVGQFGQGILETCEQRIKSLHR
jgi:hypothetical protein